MPSLLETLTGKLGGDAMRRISREIGADERQTGVTTGAALSTLLGAVARNSSSDDGARALHHAVAKDHDGSLLDNLGDLIGNPQAGSGDGILRHVLGGKRQRVETGLAKSTGMDTGSVGKLLTMLAPVVMGAIGQEQRKGNLDSGSLARLLGQERQEIERRDPQASGIFGQLLDTDDDGDVDLGDIAKHGAGLLGKLFGG
jgi:hypothetical protein